MCLTTTWDEASKVTDLEKKPLAVYAICRPLAASLAIDQLALLNVFELMALGPNELWLRGLRSWEPDVQADWLQRP